MRVSDVWLALGAVQLSMPYYMWLFKVSMARNGEAMEEEMEVFFIKGDIMN